MVMNSFLGATFVAILLCTTSVSLSAAHDSRRSEHGWHLRAPLNAAHWFPGSGRASKTVTDHWAFSVCSRPSPSKSYYWKSFEKRREVACPRWRRVMWKAQH